MGLQAFIELFMSIIVKGTPVIAVGKHPLDGFESTAQPNGVPHHGFLRLLLNSIEYIHETKKGQDSPIESIKFLHDVLYPHVSGEGPQEIASLPL